MQASVAGGERMFYTYILKNKDDNEMYVGFCEDLKRRLKEHNQGKVFATKDKIPWKVVYYEAGISKEKAIKRKKYFKTGFGRRFLKSRI